jgi:septal ring factor EnvC (AmiA/AmiB activator)
MFRRGGRFVAAVLSSGLTAAFFALSVVAPAALHAASSPTSRTRAPDPEDLRDLRARIEKLKNDVANAEDSRAEARDVLRESERAISEANRQLRELAEERQSARTEVAKLGSEAQRIEKELSGRQEAIGRLLSARYLGGEVDYLKLLLAGVDPNQTAREIHYYSYISRAHAALIHALRASLGRLKELQNQSRVKAAELVEIEAEQKKERSQLAREQLARRNVLDRVSARIREQRREIKGLERDESRLSRLIEELGKVIADEARKARSGTRKAGPRNESVPSEGEAVAGGFAALKGRLLLPVRGELVSRFGNPRAEGGPSWKGLFIRAPSGQEVKAVAPGRVVFAEWMRGFGNLLILDHGEGYLTVYGNNEAVLKRVGDTVRTGESVATTGASGGSAESGLYFETRHEGRPFDPLKWVNLR